MSEVQTDNGQVKKEKDTVNRVIQFLPENYEALIIFCDAIQVDYHSVVNMAVLSLASMETEDIIAMMNEAHEQRIQNLLKNRS